MSPTPQPFIVGTLADVDAVARGHRRQSGVGSREGGSHDAQGEEGGNSGDGIAAYKESGNVGGEQRVAGGSCARQGEQYAEREEQQVHRHEGHTIRAHILLRLAQSPACQVFLHHVLIKSRHHDDDEHAAEELFPEVLPRQPIVHHKDATHGTFGHCLYRLAQCHVQSVHHLIYNKEKRCQQTKRLQRVGNH